LLVKPPGECEHFLSEYRRPRRRKIETLDNTAGEIGVSEPLKKGHLVVEPLGVSENAGPRREYVVGDDPGVGIGGQEFCYVLYIGFWEDVVVRDEGYKLAF